MTNNGLHLDFVFCLDVSGSMEPWLLTLKEQITDLFEGLCGLLAARGLPCAGIRVRVVAFRDYAADGDDAMLLSRFFSLPEEGLSFCLTLLVCFCIPHWFD